MNQKLLIATNNRGKVVELLELLAGSNFELLSLGDLTDISEVPETGFTFAENASLKASGYALQSGLLSLADDSGLSIDALDGRPGVFSARYGGKGTTFAEKMSLLTTEVLESGSSIRTARFVCSIAISAPDGNILFSAEGVCEGVLAPSPRGSGGFGYDPLFIPDGFDRTFGELDNSIKQSISHRSKAFQQIIPFLRDFNAGGLDLNVSGA